MEWIWIIIAILVIIVAMKLLKKMFKWAFIVFFIISLLFTYYVYSDMVDFRDKFQTEEKLFLYEYDDEIIAGIYGTMEDEPGLIKENDLSMYSDYEDQDFYKVFIIKDTAFDKIEYIEIDDINLTKEEVDEIIEAEDSVKVFEKYLEDGEKLDYGSTEFKSLLFGALFEFALKKEPLFLFVRLKNEDVLVYPETFLFKFMKRMPLSFAQNFVKAEV